MTLQPTSHDAYNLMHAGALTLAEVSANGIRVDVGRLDATIGEVDQQIAEMTEELKRDEAWRLWRRRFGDKASMGSRVQLSKVLFDELGLERKEGTKKLGKRASMDKNALDGIELPFVKTWLRLEGRKKLRSTYLMGLKREVVDGYARPVFNLHLVSTFRSSADTPNIQNQIVRDPEVAKMLRQCYIPRDGCVLTECDYGALEFKVAACKWRIPELVDYASDPAKDIHRDTAALVYWLSKDQVTKNIRYNGKNKMVFPRLYGSDYVAMARSLWSVIDQMKLETKDGVGLKDHLASKGIIKLGRLDRKLPPTRDTFEWHVKRAQDRWDSWFPGLNEAKDRWVKTYEGRGWFDMMTGFRCSGVYSLNDLLNYPIQGPAFHLLLWSMIKLCKELKRRRMRTLVVAEIHDSIIADVPRDELADYFALANQVMTEDVRKHWDWVIVPLLCEPEVAVPTWADKASWTEGMAV